MKKILFVTSDRRAAQLGAHALQGIAPGSRFTWTQTPGSALRWLHANPDAAAVVIEAETQSAGESFRERVRALGFGVRVVVVPPGGMATWMTPSAAGAPHVVPPAPVEHLAGRRGEKLTVALQERLLELERTLDESRRAHKVEQLAAADRLTQRESEFAAALARAAATQAATEQGLADAIVRAAQARQRAEADLNAASLREGALRNQVAQATAAREALEQKFAASEAARVDADRRQATRVAEALARLNDLQARYDAVLAIDATARVNLEQQLADAEGARQQLVAEAADAVGREAALKDRLAREVMAREEFERNLGAAIAAGADAERRHRTELAESAARLADLRNAYDTALAEHRAARTAFDQQLVEADAERQHLVSEAAAGAAREAALVEQLGEQTIRREQVQRQLASTEAAHAEAERRHATALADAASRFDDLQKKYETAVREHEAAHTAFERQLADANGTRRQLESDAAAAALRQAALSEQLAAETAVREAIEQTLATVEAARADEESRHAVEAAKAAAHLASLATAYDDAVAEHAAARASLELQVSEAAASNQDLLSQVTAAAEREAALSEQLAREIATRGALEQKLAEAEAARLETDRRHAIELEEAGARLADLQSAYEAARAAHAAARAALGAELADAAADAAAAAQVRRDLESELVRNRAKTAAARRRLLHLAIRRRRRTREIIAQLAAQLDRERASAQQTIADRDAVLRETEAERTRLSAEYDQARQSLDHLGISFVALEGVATDNAAERARLEAVVAERDAQLRLQLERQLAAERKATDSIETLRQELLAASTRVTTLQRDAERAAVLQSQLEEALRESRRLFERAPYGLCRFMPDGAFIKGNHSFARLLGYRKADDLRSLSLGTVFECAADLRWVVDRAARTATATIETALKTRDGRRVDTRLHALGHADGTVDVAVQDLSSVRALEARLSKAQRMEAVGRLASEVAVTCDIVLRDVTDDGRAWLAAIDTHPELRQRGEMLLGEVTRAAGFLRAFSVYGSKQVRALEPVSVQQVIRNLAPVLKRVAGDDIEWVVPKLSRPAYVDMDPERVERVLVNVANYARERMPQGGRVRIEVATTVLGRDFTARYPNVRPGAHVLITIAEAKRGDRAERWPDARTTALATTGAASATSIRTGVDLGALLALLGDCGGHLWIAAEQSGNMTLQIHLPRRMSTDVAVSSRPPASKTQRVRQLAGWFRH